MKANNIEGKQGVGEIGEGKTGEGQRIIKLDTGMNIRLMEDGSIIISPEEKHSEAQKSAEDRDTKVRKLRILSSALKFFGGIFSSIGAPIGIFVTALISACVIAGPVVVKIAIASFVIAILGILILAISVFLDNMVATITGKANILKNS